MDTEKYIAKLEVENKQLQAELADERADREIEKTVDSEAVLGLRAEVEKLETKNKRLKEENKNLKSGHFCPNPQLGKLATVCDCAHSDRHRAIDWAHIEQLQTEVKQLKRVADAAGSLLLDVQQDCVKLKADLSKYGKHKSNCAYIDNLKGNTIEDCDCGFEQAVKGVKKTDVFEIRIPNLRPDEIQYTKDRVSKFTKELLNELTAQRKQRN